MHHSEYDPSLASAVLDQAAGLLKSIGLAAHHVILIGGSVPGLLVPELDPGIDPHVWYNRPGFLSQHRHHRRRNGGV